MPKQVNPKKQINTLNQAPMDKSKSQKRNLWLKISLVGILVLITILSPGGLALAYKNKIYPNVKIAGVNIGGMTLDQAKEALNTKIGELKQNGPILTYENQVLTPSLEELGVTFDSSKALETAFDYGRNQPILTKIVSYLRIITNTASLDMPDNVDPEKTKSYVDKLSTDIAKPATNAGVSVVNGQVVTSPPQEGYGFDNNKILEDINNFINKSDSSKKIVLELTKVEPPILTENTLKAVAQTNKYLASLPINVYYNESHWTTNRVEIGNWMKYSVKGNELVVNVDPSSFIKKIDKQVSIPMKPRQIEDGTGTVLDEGQNGLGIDEKVLSAKIKTALDTQKNMDIPLPVFDIARTEKIVYPHAMPGRYPGRYIDVNLSEQRLYAFEGFTQVNTFLISSGISSHPTPTGEFHVYAKTSSQLMDGPGYYLPNVPWISWFSGDYSIHGTYWHHNFGHPMSHGCVNASISDAEWIYNWDDIGTPVYIHY